MKKNYLKIKISKFFAIIIAILFFGNFQKSEAQDMGATVLVAPTFSMCAANNQAVIVTVKNFDVGTIDFSVNSTTVTVLVTGASTQTFTIVLNTGILMPGSTQDATVTVGANMTASGVHTFNAATSVIGDVDNSNDAMPIANVTVNPIPTTTITVTDASCSAKCDGTMNSSSTPSGSFIWSGGLNPGNNQIMVCPGVYTATVTVNGCAGTATATVGFVNTSPTVNLGADITQCGGMALLDAGNVGSTYSWSNLATTQTVSVSSGTYSVVVTGTNTCSNSDTIMVTINAVPTLSVIASNTTICNGTAVTFTTSGATTYTWSANAGSQTTSTISITPSSADTYTVTGDMAGCTATETVMVNVTPTPTVTIAASNTVICAGSAVTFTAGGATTYTWMPGGTTSSTLTATPGTTTIYTLTGDNAGCTATQTASVNVTNGPVVTTSVTAATCPSGNNGSATALGIGTGSITYTWMPGGLNTATISGLNPNVYTVTVVDGSACSTIATATISNPGAGLQTTLAAGNQHNGNMFDIVATNNTFITSFDCHLDTLQTGAAADSVKIYYIPSTFVGNNANPGAWTLLGTAHVVSAGIGVATSVPIPVNVTIPAGQTYGFYITRITAASCFLKYTNGATFGATFASNADFAFKEGKGVAYPFGTTYPTSGTASRVWNGIIHFCNTVGVEQQLASSINSEVYPQPMVDEATIKITGLNTKGTITLKVYDVTGKLVKEATSANTEEIKVNRDNMTDGMYFYNVYNEEHKIVCKGKFIVQ